MFNRQLKNIVRSAVLAFMLGANAGLASADTLRVEIDTSAFGSEGWIDLLFLPFGNKAVQATAMLSDFVGFDAVAGAQPFGGVSGSLADGYILSNQNGGADLFHAVNFGGKVSFNVDFTGAADAALNQSTSTLTVAMYGADQTTLLGSGDAASGALVQLYWLPSASSSVPGTVSHQVFDSIASVSPVAAVPEPSSWLMMGAGLGLLGLARRRQTNAVFNI
jgi:hypothetical protein